MNNYNYFNNSNELNSNITPFNTHLLGFNSEIKITNGDQEQIIKNINFLNTKIAKSSIDEVFVTWLDAISSQSRRKSSKEISKINDGKPDWDYVVYGYSERTEDLGNVNYGATGYYLFAKSLIKLGFDLDYIDKPIRMILRLGGGAYQIFGDLKYDEKNNIIKFRDVDRNWYGEEIKDASRVEAGMDFGKFLIIKESLKEVGVELDVEKFGYKSNPEYHLLEQEKRNKEFDKIRKEIEELSEKINELRNSNNKKSAIDI